MAYKDPQKQREAHRRYRASARGKEVASSPKRKAWLKQYFADPEVRARRLANQKKYRASPKGKAAKKRDYERYKAEVNEGRKKWRDRNPERLKAYVAVRRERKRANKEFLAGRPKPDACEICGGNEGGIVFDHSHKFGHFRGWLCDRCNSALGFANDDPILLMKMASYLLRTKDSTEPQLALPGI